MKFANKIVTIPEIGLIVLTRVALGAGIGLLLGHRLGKEKSTAAGWALVLVGLVTTLPLAIEVLNSRVPELMDSGAPVALPPA